MQSTFYVLWQLALESTEKEKLLSSINCTATENLDHCLHQDCETITLSLKRASDREPIEQHLPFEHSLILEHFTSWVNCSSRLQKNEKSRIRYHFPRIKANGFLYLLYHPPATPTLQSNRRNPLVSLVSVSAGGVRCSCGLRVHTVPRNAQPPRAFELCL